MADTTPTKKTPAKSAKGAAAMSEGPVKAAPRKTAAANKGEDATPASPQVVEAKSRFNAALEEAKAGAAALRAEAENRLSSVGGQAKGKGTDLVAEAKNYGEQAKGKASELAVEGKQVATDAIASLGKVVGDTAVQIDEKLGEQYGDYARKASRTLQETSAKLEAKSVEELSEDARAAVRKSPGVAVGVAALVGFFLARMLGGKRR
ncbi:hypothetical protein C0V72_14515 [Porphyrobacter sp. TH134]|uniref:hypothetical protein n=1 Tax=Porphyrobacter sp. TH134 TaxID=2067450 RepID=UPI000C7AE227|nr:hypothetical protein [Porphyrobacter sp. TH134]PLK22517.1 hypothetical protein C0V72_14515 [Porphyrobacter sp. TH134]